MANEKNLIAGKNKKEGGKRTTMILSGKAREIASKLGGGIMAAGVEKALRQQSFIAEATKAEFDPGLILDFLDAIESDPIYMAWKGEPTIPRLEEYRDDMDSRFYSQAAWDASCVNEPILPK